MPTRFKKVICLDCGNYLVHKAKGLCRYCYAKKQNMKFNKINPNYFSKNYLKHKDRIMKYNSEQYLNGKGKARKDAKAKKLKGDSCFICKGINNLEFHHIDYNLNLGFTLCRICHKSYHALLSKENRLKKQHQLKELRV